MGSIRLRFLVIILCYVLLMGSAPVKGTIHTVQRGETLAGIVDMYLPYTAAYTKKELFGGIKEINGITGDVRPGQALTIPIVRNRPLRPEAVARPSGFAAKGLYMTAVSASSRFIFDSARRLIESGGNTLVFDAKDDMGLITYESTVAERYALEKRYPPNIPELPKMIESLHSMGIHVVARVVVFKDRIMSQSRPQWCMDSASGWLDPANPEVQAYLLAIIEELAFSGVDEIQLDYIRYYSDRKTTTGIEGVSRTEVIAGFIEKAHEITRPNGILLSVDIFGIMIWQRDVDVLVIGQDINMIKPHVEIISPMIYPSHFSAGFDGVDNPADNPYRFVFKGIKKMKELVGDDVIIRPWLQSFPLRITTGFNPEYIRSQIQASNDAGGTGWLLWSPGNHYRKAYAAMKVPQEQLQDEEEMVLPQENADPEQPGKPAEALSVGRMDDTGYNPDSIL